MIVGEKITQMSSIIVQENTDSNNHELDGFFSSLKWVQAKFMVQSKTQQQHIKHNIFGSLVDDEIKISEYNDDMTISFYDKREKEAVSLGLDLNNNHGYTFVNGDNKSDETNQILSKLDYREHEKETSNSSDESIKDNKSDDYNQSSSEEEIPVVNHYFKEIYDINNEAPSKTIESPDELKHATVTILTNSMTLNECKLKKSPIIELEEESFIEVPVSECQQSQKPPDLLEMCRRLKSNPDKIILKTPNCKKKLFVMKLKLPEPSRPKKQDSLREMLKNLPK